MAIVFAYTVATNTVVVTGGTSGTPATFADFVTADRAGTGTSLKAATAASKTLTLTYPVRPVELLAIVVKLIVASKTTETDYLFITGTDAWDAAQTESIDVSAGNGTYTSTKRWRTITNISCDDAVDGSGTVWADGTLAVTQDIWGVIWNLGDSVTYVKQYRVDAIFKIGDASTSTYFTETKCQVVFSDLKYFQTTAAAVATFGVKNSATSAKSGCHIITVQNSNVSTEFQNLGTLNLYDTIWQELGSQIGYQCMQHTFGGTHELIQDSFLFKNTGGLKSSPTIYNVFVNECWNGITLWQAGSATGLVRDSGLYYGVCGFFNGSFTLINSTFLTFPQPTFRITFPTVIYLIDCIATSWTFSITNASGAVWDQHYCDINVCDKDGVAISGAVVDCEDVTATAVWTAGTVTTDANGDITKQTITRRKWVGTTPTLTTYSPHKFTISKAGYQTLVLENITVSSPIKWHVELQPAGTANMSRVRVGH
jgi:hypothetical protein